MSRHSSGTNTLETRTHLDHVLDGKFIALDRTPFYVTVRGQVDDTGVVEETFSRPRHRSVKRDKRIIHEVVVIRGDDPHRSPASASRRTSTARALGISSATTLRPILCTRRSGACWGRTCISRVPSLPPTGCGLTLTTSRRSPRKRSDAIEDIVNDKIAGQSRPALNDPKIGSRSRKPSADIRTSKCSSATSTATGPGCRDRSEFSASNSAAGRMSQYRRYRAFQDRERIGHRQRRPAHRGGHRGRTPHVDREGDRFGEGKRRTDREDDRRKTGA